MARKTEDAIIPTPFPEDFLKGKIDNEGKPIMTRKTENKEFWLVDPDKIEWELKGIVENKRFIPKTAELIELSMRRAKLRIFTREELARQSDATLAKSLRRCASVKFLEKLKNRANQKCNV